MILSGSIFLSSLVAALVNTATKAAASDSDSMLPSNPSARLKPLTPIAGTNLFLNTLYKWHDHTKPGCYATWFMESYPNWYDKNKIVSMVCNRDDQKWYNTTDSDWIFERTEGADSMSEYDGTVKIKNVGAADTLKTWNSIGPWLVDIETRLVGITTYGFNPVEDLWKVRSDSSNNNHIQLEIENWFLAQNPTSNHRAYMFLKNGDTAGFPYSFVPAVSLVAKLYDFEFTRPQDEELDKHTTQKGLIDSYTINNDSPGTLSRTIKVSETVTNEFSWGFSESLKIFAKVTGSAGIPFLAEDEVETGIEIDIAASQEWKNSVEKSFEMAYDVQVPAYTQITVSAWYDLIKGISMDYTATAEITGHTARISVFNDIVTDTPATGEMIRNHLGYLNFDGKIVDVKDNSVIVQIKGTMVASVGVRGRLNVNGDTVSKTNVPQATQKILGYQGQE